MFKELLEGSLTGLFTMAEDTIFKGIERKGNDLKDMMECLKIYLETELYLNHLDKDLVEDKVVHSRVRVCFNRIKMYWHANRRWELLQYFYNKPEKDDTDYEIIFNYINGFFYGNVAIDNAVCVVDTIDQVDGYHYNTLKVYDYDDMKHRKKYGKYIPKLVNIIANTNMWKLYLTSYAYVCVEYKYTQKNKVSIDNQLVVDIIKAESAKRQAVYVPLENDTFFYLSVKLSDGTTGLDRILSDIGIKTEFYNLSFIKQFARSKKIFSGSYTKVNFKSNVKWMDSQMYRELSELKKDYVKHLFKNEGLIYIDKSVGKKYNLENGMKMAVTGKSLIFLVPDLYKAVGAHVLFSADENKLSIPIERMNSLFYVSTVKAVDVANTTKEEEYDSMSIWANANLNYAPEISHKKIGNMIDMFKTHKISQEFIDNVVNYKSRGIVTESSLSVRLKDDVWDSFTKKEFDELMMRVLRSEACGHDFQKIIAFAMPDSLLSMEDGEITEVTGLVIRYPNSVPFKMTVKMCKSKGIVYLPYEFIYVLSGGDCDGDLFITYIPNSYNGLNYIDYTNTAAVNKYKAFIKSPERKVSASMTQDRAIKNMLDSMKNIGLCFRMAMTIKEVFEMVYDREFCMYLSVYLNSNIVQRAIDALKHSDEFVLPSRTQVLEDIFKNLSYEFVNLSRSTFIERLDVKRQGDKYFANLMYNAGASNDNTNYLSYLFAMSGAIISKTTKEYSLDNFVRKTKIAFNVYSANHMLEDQVVMQIIPSKETFLQRLYCNMLAAGISHYSLDDIEDNHKKLGYDSVYLYVNVENVEGFIKSYVEIRIGEDMEKIKRISFNYRVSEDGLILNINPNCWDIRNILKKDLPYASPCEVFNNSVKTFKSAMCGVDLGNGVLDFAKKYKYCYTYIKLVK